jgi:hypothetical protein
MGWLLFIAACCMHDKADKDFLFFIWFVYIFLSAFKEKKEDKQ